MISFSQRAVGRHHASPSSCPRKASVSRRLLAALGAVAAASVAVAAPASASELAGIWLDHTGRGAVRIADCNGAVCGRIVWVKNTDHGSVCGLQVIGGAKPVGGGRYDGGWIYDPEDKARYDVELTPLAGGKLQVLGYLGMKMLGQTMIWTRAPANLKLCGT